MNVLIYIPELNQEWGGVRQYAIGLVRILAQDLENSYFLYHNCADPEITNLLSRHTNLKIVRDADVEWNQSQLRLARGKRILNAISVRINQSSHFEILSTIDRLIDRFNIDIVHCPYQFIPTTTKAKLIVTLHDVQELHFPDFFTAEARAHRAVNYLDYLRRADSVIVSYKHVKDDIVRFFAVPDSIIHVILLDMSMLWFENFASADAVSIGQLELPEKFLFYPANTWKHKNHSLLIQAVALMRDKYNCVINLVCSGHTNEYYENVLSSEVANYNLQHQIKFVGVVEENILFSLYHHCLGVIVPTLYEAGSFPLMESILMGIPVICSNVTSLPETVDDEDFIFDPLDTESIAAKIKLLWESEEFRDKSTANGLRVGHKLKDAGALKKIVSIYNKI